MFAKARLAKFEKSDANISVKKKASFPGSSLHGHDFYELNIITSGRTSSIVNDKPYEARRGVVFFMTPADFHEFAFEDPFDSYNIQFATETVTSEILERLVSQRDRVFYPDGESFERIVKMTDIMDSINADGGNDSIMTKLLECILLSLFASSGKDIQGESCEARRNPFIQKSIIYIHEHFKENPTLSEVAAVVPLNERYFCKKFREYTGFTYKEYLKKLKLRYARRLLLVTELSVAEIAEASGYATQSHFNREFKNYYGISPISMRKSSH